VSSTSLTKGETSTAPAQPSIWARWFTGRQGRRVREAFLAYLFLFPAFLIIGLFGLFPLLFAAFQSTLRGLNRIVGTYDGIGNYVRAIDNLAYVLFFWLAAILLVLAVRNAMQTLEDSRTRNMALWPWLAPGVALGAGTLLFLLFIWRALPEVLQAPSSVRGRLTGPMFRELMWDALTTPGVVQAWWAAIGALVVGLLLMIWVGQQQQKRTIRVVPNYSGAIATITLMLALAALLAWWTWSEISNAYASALEAGEGLDIWSQIITISAGFLLLLLAWWLWGSANDRPSNTGVALRLGAAAMLLVGGWFLIAELPGALAAGDAVWWQGVLATFYYSLGTIPVQLGIALVLAVLLFQDIRGKSLFRIIYFIPYIAPFVGTAAVFRIMFSGRPSAPINYFLTTTGATPLQWLNEPAGIFQMIAGNTVNLPTWAAGPSLSLVVIIIYGTWTFIGFNTVIFMAGLGAIPKELYEAASIDGGGRWAQFRHITLPMLSPTLYFLTLYSVIGTFKAFNHIYVLRTAAALGTTDTASIVIFNAFKRDTRYGYASALAILLLVIILVLTVVNNRIASRRVFYG
jgi:ABC-type sugar transport system permease subunit